VKKICILFLSLAALYAQSQTIYYAAAKTGISLREAPNPNAKVLEKITYGEKLITQADTLAPKSIVTEGFNGFWWKVTYNNKIGYVVSNYLLTVAPPKAGIKTLKEYFAQLLSAAGNPLVLKKTDEALHEMGESTLTKQFFKNGMEWHEAQGYEYGSEVYILPGFSIEQSFLLLRILNQFPDLIGEKDIFPNKKTTLSLTGGEKTTEVEKDIDGPPGAIKKIKIYSTQGAFTEFEIFMLDNQAVIYRNSGA